MTRTSSQTLCSAFRVWMHAKRSIREAAALGDLGPAFPMSSTSGCVGTVDASVVAAAERLGVESIATFDRRHFGVVRPAHTSMFNLVP